MPEPEKLDINSLASKVAENVKKGINDGTLLTVAGVKLHLDKLVDEALPGNTGGITGLADSVKALVLQNIPASSVFNDQRAKGYDPEVGIKSLSKERAAEIKAELTVAILGTGNLDLLASKLGMDVVALRGGYDRLSANTKTLSSQVGATAGFAIPVEFVAEVQRKLVKASVLRGNARVWSGVGLKGSIPRETGTVTVSYASEQTQPSNTDPTLGAQPWGLNKRFTLMSLTGELFKFSGVDIISLLSTMLAEQNRVKDDSVFMVGSGSGVPMGISTKKTGMGAVALAGASLDYDDLVNLKHSLGVQYRLDGAAFYMNNTVLQIVAKLRDNQGRPLFLDHGSAGIGGPNIPAQTIGYILGLPVMECAGSLSTEIMCANLKRGYSIFDGPGMEFATSNEASDAFLKDLIYARGISYDDGSVSIPEAISFLTGVK